MLDQEQKINNSLKSNDRVIVLSPIEGKNTVSNTGLTDNRLFTGDNKLHAILDEQHMLWSLRYEKGITPAPLQQKFTNFRILLEFVKEYYNRRNIAVKEVIE